MDFASLDTKDCPYYLVTRASLSITAEFKRAFAAAGVDIVKPAYLGVLLCLWKESSMDETLGKLGAPEGIRLADLGRRAGLEPSTMTGVIDRMERDGLVCRDDDPEDRRVQIIRLTDRGEELRGPVIAAVDYTLKKAMAGIEPERLEIAKDVLRHVLINAGRGGLE
ncbi:MAG: MarR family transcriptional regulator [Spirochaetes bacterium]|nr:MarR family transcriptional regulator [Spirochaetota bacterium]